MFRSLQQLSRHPIAHSLASVGLIQGLSMLLPLLTIPYLLSVLGPSGFALVNLALAITTYFVVLSDYGFNLMGTRLVTLHRNDPQRLNQIFSSMLYAQLLLTLAGACLFAILILSVPAYRAELSFFAATFGVVIGATLLPTWFFQGKEKFKQLHLITLAYRAIYTLAIFSLIHDESDLIKVPLLNSLTSIGGGLLGLTLIITRYKMRLQRWNWREIMAFLRQGWNLFISAISVTSLQQLPIIILAFFVSSAVVGYYAFAEKILLLFRVLIQLLSSIIYPRVVKASQQSRQAAHRLLSQLRKMGSILLLLPALLIFFSPELLERFLPQYYDPALAGVLRIWALLPLAIFHKIVAQQLLLAYDHTRSYARVMMLGALVNTVLLLALTLGMAVQGTALAVILTEVFLIFALNLQSRPLAPEPI